MYLYLKALHIIFVVTWFAGLFYMPRLLIYCREALDNTDKNTSNAFIAQYQLMQRRLWYGITFPSMVITWLFGLSLLHNWLNPMPQWLIVKLFFVVLLTVYHLATHFIFKQQQQNIFKYTSMQLRIWNEVATVFLFAIVFLVVLKDVMSLITAMLLLAGLIAVLLIAIYIYRKIRNS